MREADCENLVKMQAALDGTYIEWDFCFDGVSRVYLWTAERRRLINTSYTWDDMWDWMARTPLEERLTPIVDRVRP